MDAATCCAEHRHQKRLPVYAIVEASASQRFLAWLKAQRAEFIDLHTAAKAQGREGMPLHDAQLWVPHAHCSQFSSPPKNSLFVGSAPSTAFTCCRPGHSTKIYQMPVTLEIPVRTSAAVVRVHGVGEMSVSFEVLLRGAESLGYSF